MLPLKQRFQQRQQQTATPAVQSGSSQRDWRRPTAPRRDWAAATRRDWPSRLRALQPEATQPQLQQKRLRKTGSMQQHHRQLSLRLLRQRSWAQRSPVLAMETASSESHLLILVPLKQQHRLAMRTARKAIASRQQRRERREKTATPQLPQQASLRRDRQTAQEAELQLQRLQRTQLQAQLLLTSVQREMPLQRRRSHRCWLPCWPCRLPSSSRGCSRSQGHS